MTSNIGVKKLQDFGTGIGFSSNAYSNEEQKKEILKKEMKNYFSPEFLNRIDDTIVFNSLTEESIKQIVNIELTKLMKRLGELKLVFKFDDKLVSHISKVGFDDTYGARPIKRAIQDQVEDLISEEVLNGNVIEGKQYTLSIKTDKVVIK
jgi:ATP-dependent Clp protease ATP-binding subunit ClpC